MLVYPTRLDTVEVALSSASLSLTEDPELAKVRLTKIAQIASVKIIAIDDNTTLLFLITIIPSFYHVCFVSTYEFLRLTIPETEYDTDVRSSSKSIVIEKLSSSGLT